MRKRAIRIVERAGLLGAARAVRDAYRLAVDRSIWMDFDRFRSEVGDGLCGEPFLPPGGGRKKALIVSFGLYGLPVEIFLAKGLELAGFSPIVLARRDPWLSRYYRAAGVKEVRFWDELMSPPDAATVRGKVEGLRSFQDLISLEDDGIRIGKYAAATAFRGLRVGSLGLGSREDREKIVPYVAAALEAAAAARRIVEEVSPDVSLSLDIGYTPQGQVFDACRTAGVDTVTWNSAHKRNTLMLKRYGRENRDVHPASLSIGSWRTIRAMAWTERDRAALHRELSENYRSGDWYSEVGTQFEKRLFAEDELQDRLGLDPSKKTAVIFPHIVWDGTFFYGSDLFSTYEEWLVETVRAACGNDRVNWLVKIHPANVVKNARDGVSSEAGEVRIIREQIGRLPDHVRLIPAESDINTFSLFGLMDCCVTVRGTIGLEAAAFGIPALTAGTGRYDRLGFTIDSEDRKTYLDRLGRIQDVPRLSDEQRELAERYAFGTFIARPFPLSTVTYEHHRDAKATLSCRIKAKTREDWLNAPDLNAFAKWVQSGEEDFLSEDIGRQAGAGAESLTEEGART